MGLCPICLVEESIDVGAGVDRGAETDPPGVTEGVDGGEDLAEPSAGPPSGGSVFGPYELIQRIARGGMGVVYRACHSRTRRTVALKMILGGELPSEAEVYRFHAEAAAASQLDHPGIVPIYEVGEHEGRHYFTMKLMKGGSLAESLGRFRGKPTAAARLVETIAQAVHYGHQRGILHRDLKPGNILLDGEGNPHVADFGVAKFFDPIATIGRLDHTGAVVGTPGYMAPEQADRRTRTLTTAADVYSLGVILYELLTGLLPFEGEDPDDVFDKVMNGPPPDPRAVEPGIDRDLATVCLRCLEKEPAHRYGSAEELALELRRYLDGEPVLARPIGAVARAWRWCKRRPYSAAIGAELALFVVVATLAALSGAAGQESDRRAEVLRANEYAARWVAGTVLYKLSSYHDAVAQGARDFPPELMEALRQAVVRDSDALQDHCQKLHERNKHLGGGQSPFDGWLIVGKEGRIRARWPRSRNGMNDFIGKDYSWRDYFKGAWKLADAGLRSAHISRAFVSEVTQTERFTVSAPIYDENGSAIAVLVANSDAGATLGTLQLKDPSDGRHIAMVVAPRDNERAEANEPLPTGHVILVHDALGAGTNIPLKSSVPVREAVALAEQSHPNRGLDQLQLADPHAVTSEDGFCDPVMDGRCNDDAAKPSAGAWLAGFAPIGNTGYVAIVETPREAAARPNETLGRRLLLWGGLPFAAGTAVLAISLGYARRRGERNGQR